MRDASSCSKGEPTTARVCKRKEQLAVMVVTV